MDSSGPNKLYFSTLSILSFVRFGIYILWTYRFRVFILPVIFVTEEALFLLLHLPMILAVLDLVSIGIVLEIRNKALPILLIGIFAGIAYSWFLAINFVGGGLGGILLMAVSILQFIILSLVILNPKHPDHI